MQYKIIQEQKCLQTKAIIDLLRTKLIEIDNFEDYQIYDKVLKKLKRKIDEIYWKI